MATVNLPPWLRRIQQSWWFLLIVQPFFGAALPVLYTSSDGFSNVTHNDIKACLIAGGLTLYASYQKSFGSDSFNKDGTDNLQVKEVVEADSANRTVVVVPVASPQVREQIRILTDAGAPVAVVAAPEAALSAQIKAANADPRSMTTASISCKPS